MKNGKEMMNKMREILKEVREKREKLGDKQYEYIKKVIEKDQKNVEKLEEGTCPKCKGKNIEEIGKVKSYIIKYRCKTCGEIFLISNMGDDLPELI